MKYSEQNVFSDNSLDTLIESYRLGGSDNAREVAKSFNMDELIFGLLPSDFLYYLPLNDQAKVLDVACGLGTHSFNIGKFAGEVYGCDPSQKKIAFCEARKQSENSKNIHFLNADIKDLPFQPNTFNAIIVDRVTERMNEEKKSTRRECIEDVRRMYALLKPGGVLYFGAHTHFRGGLERALRSAGFRSDIYIAYPSHHLPRFLVPFHDMHALKFIINTISADKGIVGAAMRFFIKIPLLSNGMRIFFSSYAVFIKK